MFIRDKRTGSVKIITPGCELVPIRWNVALSEEVAAHYGCYIKIQKDKEVIIRLASSWPISGIYKRHLSTGVDKYSSKPQGTFFRGAKVLLGGRI